ncbi:hypothetical protein BYT27DRAFT_7186695 [Phlegmacium glaucopus]|nr:hypothetical protein BYT27DRAFT_7186695 [Phlegmacium glaucopus]
MPVRSLPSFHYNTTIASEAHNSPNLSPVILHMFSMPTHEPSIPHSEKFYFPDSAGGLSVFKVAGIYYKVHRYLLDRESPVFKEMFSSPPPYYEGRDGRNKERPINIPDVSRSEFEALLDFLYNGGFSCFKFDLFIHLKDIEISANAAPKQKIKLFEETITNIRRRLFEDGTFTILDLLSISLRFEFDRIAKLAVGIIDLLDKWHAPDFVTWQGDLQVIKRIKMALRHDALQHWCLPALQVLISRPAPLTAEEGRSLGYRRMSIIAAEREKASKSGNSNIKSIPPGFLFPWSD